MSNRFLHGAVAAFSLSFAAAGAVSAATPSTSVETLVLVRHGEKPADVDNGQLTCTGQNRALALPGILTPKFGVPNYVFAAKTKENKDSNGVDYWYLRALATIEPTAIAAGVTVDVKYKTSDYDKLEKELLKSQYENATVFVAWEHNDLDKLAANIVKDYGGDASVVPAWPDDYYDSIFVITLTRSGGHTQVSFAHDSEGLTATLSPNCAVPQAQ
ncbi:MAG: hypothetical protein QM741_12175 [Rudaea sp.]|uniref:hypothetical protein n=1 Tax=Rudaea sp. TaxID=2136325 RepID=UPI0039E3B96E